MIHGSYICNERLLAPMQASRVAAGETGRFSRIVVGEHYQRILDRKGSCLRPPYGLGREGMGWDLPCGPRLTTAAS